MSDSIPKNRRVRKAATTDQPKRANIIQRFERQQGIRLLIVCLVVTGLVVCMLLLHVWFRYRIMKVGYEMATLTREHNQILEEQRRLEIELRLLSRSDVLEEAARTKIGMTDPKMEQIVVIETNLNSTE